MKFISYLIFSLGMIYSLTAAVSDNEDQTTIFIRLTTDNQLLPIHLAAMNNHGSGFDQNYINQLERILNFDLNHNGMTYTINKTKDQERLLGSSDLGEFGDPQQWSTSQIYYVIKTQVSNGAISAAILAVNEQTIKKVDKITLSGKLSEDRRQIHLLSDTIHKALFGSDGVASTRFIYTVKNRSTQDQKKWVSEIWEADYDGENSRQITTGGNYCVTPVYIPPKAGFASGNIMYVSYQIGQPKIYIASLKDGIGKRVILMRGNQLMPAISRQRNQIALISDISGNPDLFIQTFSTESGAQGKPRQIFSAKLATQASPTFSPDGKKIAFVSDKDGSPKIYLLDIPEGETSIKDLKPVLLTKYGRESSAPAWSPDGTKIAYCSKIKGIRQIWIYDFNTKEEKQITQGPGNKENPTWAPNSLHLIFNSSDANSSELYLINLNQRDAVKISSGSGEKRYPSWEPRT